MLTISQHAEYIALLVLEISFCPKTLHGRANEPIPFRGLWVAFSAMLYGDTLMVVRECCAIWH